MRQLAVLDLLEEPPKGGAATFRPDQDPDMKTLGIIGGIAPGSTVDCHRLLITE